MMDHRALVHGTKPDSPIDSILAQELQHQIYERNLARFDVLRVSRVRDDAVNDIVDKFIPEIERLREQNNNLKLESLHALAQANKIITALQLELEASHAALANTQRQMLSHQAHSAALGAELNNIKTRLDTNKKELRTTTNQLTSAKATIQNNTQRLQEHMEACEHADNTQHQQAREIQFLKDQVGQLTNKTQHLHGANLMKIVLGCTNNNTDLTTQQGQKAAPVAAAEGALPAQPTQWYPPQSQPYYHTNSYQHCLPIYFPKHHSHLTHQLNHCQLPNAYLNHLSQHLANHVPPPVRIPAVHTSDMPMQQGPATPPQAEPCAKPIHATLRGHAVAHIHANKKHSYNHTNGSFKSGMA